MPISNCSQQGQGYSDEKTIARTVGRLSGPTQATAFEFDTSRDWEIRWDNTIKGNLMSRVASQEKDVYDPRFSRSTGSAAIADDDSDHPENGPTKGFPSAYSTWGSLSVKPGNYLGVEFLVNEVWDKSAKYNFYFGPQGNGTSAFIKDRDNIAFTIKRTF